MKNLNKMNKKNVSNKHCFILCSITNFSYTGEYSYMKLYYINSNFKKWNHTIFIALIDATCYFTLKVN